MSEWRWANWLHDLDFLVTAADFSREAYELCTHNRGMRDYLTVLAESGGKLPFADNTFDMLFTYAVLMHITDEEEWQAAAAELRRVLKPDASLVIVESLGPVGYPVASHNVLRSAQQYSEVFGLLSAVHQGRNRELSILTGRLRKDEE